MTMRQTEIAKRADAVVNWCGVRDPRAIARELGIEIMARSFTAQKGAYKVIVRVPFIFIKSDLDPVMEKLVLAHELGHHVLHRREAEEMGGFQEFDIFNTLSNRMEYEANVFAAQLTLPDEEFLELTEQGRTTREIAAAMESDVNLVALKADLLIARGHNFVRQEHRSGFLSSLSKKADAS